MKIYDQNLTGAAAEASRSRDLQKTGSGKSSEPGRAGGADGGDRVEFSSRLGQLARAVSAYGAGRSNRVAELAASYRSGGYRPDAAGAARGLVSEALSGGE